MTKMKIYKFYNSEIGSDKMPTCGINFAELIKEELAEIKDAYDRYHDFCTVLVIDWEDGTYQIETDRGEPEDQTFGRDWRWVEPALVKAYHAGKASK